MNTEKIEDTTYYYNDAGYILRKETVFSNGYSECVALHLMPLPNSNEYYVAHEKIVFEDPEARNSGYMNIHTVIKESGYSVMSQKFDDISGESCNVTNFSGYPPVAAKFISQI